MKEINEQLEIKLAVDLDEINSFREFDKITESLKIFDGINEQFKQADRLNEQFKQANELIQQFNPIDDAITVQAKLWNDTGDALKEYDLTFLSEDRPVFVAKDETAELLKEHIKEQKKQTELLAAIKSNTNKIYDLADILKENSDKQNEILSLIAEIKAISDAPANERESLVSKVHEKIQALQTTVETGQFLYGLLQTAQSFF